MLESIAELLACLDTNEQDKLQRRLTPKDNRAGRKLVFTEEEPEPVKYRIREGTSKGFAPTENACRTFLQI